MITSNHYQHADIIIKENDPGETAYIIKNRIVRVAKEIINKILKVLFGRLQKSNAMVSQINEESSKTKDKLCFPLCDIPVNSNFEVLLEGVTHRAGKSLPNNPYHIKKFPFRIGRKTKDPLSFNHLYIADKKPYRISRSHIKIDRHENGVIAVDMGSQLGSIFDDRQLGGAEGNLGVLIFSGMQGTLVLGDKNSPYQYRVIIKSS
ncbi:MAG: hypothetical protein HN737_04215 [Desulfobacterales bacterium]|nr:hypothetical protein [Desulfobacteraceae bacterium]MBT4364845.1 hypothetical protein [Desulfobacteraceae bacterium]MBT7085196.1 hypothetical protein [Desulfobacterales bacterium]MBT7696597.1 hypothetical protein [Desulfobacterales bacterium]